MPDVQSFGPRRRSSRKKRLSAKVKEFLPNLQEEYTDLPSDQQDETEFIFRNENKKSAESSESSGLIGNDENGLEFKGENMEVTESPENPSVNVNKHDKNRQKVCVFCFRISQKTVFSNESLLDKVKQSLNLEDIRIPVGLCQECIIRPSRYKLKDGSLIFACSKKFK